MKKWILVLWVGAAFCAVPKTQSAQKNRPHLIDSKSLVGFWQKVEMFGTSDSTYAWRSTGDYKVLMPDGTYFMYAVQPLPEKLTGGKTSPLTIIVHYGTYEITSDSTYVEHMIGSHMDVMKQTPDIGVRYRWISPDAIVVECGPKEMRNKLVETWFRTTLYDPAHKNQSVPEPQEAPFAGPPSVRKIE